MFEFLFGQKKRSGDMNLDKENGLENGKFHVRKYRSSDRKAVLKIAQKDFEGVSLDQNIEQMFGKMDKSWEEKKKDTVDYDLKHNLSHAFVAETKEGKISGFICTRLHKGSKLGHVVNLAVGSDYQRMGIGRALMRAAIEHFSNEGMKYVRIETLKQNEKAQKFYPLLGFKEVGRQIFYFKEL